MAKFLYVFCVLSIIQISTCFVKREVQKENSLEALANQTENVIKELHANFLKFVGVKDNEELITLVKSHGQNYAENIQGLVSQLSEEAKENAGKFDGMWQDVTKQLSATVEELKAKNPELSANAEKLQEKFEESLKSVLQNTEQLSASWKAQGQEVSSQAQEVFKKIYDNTREAAQKLAADIESTVKKSN